MRIRFKKRFCRSLGGWDSVVPTTASLMIHLTLPVRLRAASGQLHSPTSVCSGHVALQPHLWGACDRGGLLPGKNPDVLKCADTQSSNVKVGPPKYVGPCGREIQERGIGTGSSVSVY